jgi:hypothetical protein
MSGLLVQFVQAPKEPSFEDGLRFEMRFDPERPEFAADD